MHCSRRLCAIIKSLCSLWEKLSFREMNKCAEEVSFALLRPHTDRSTAGTHTQLRGGRAAREFNQIQEQFLSDRCKTSKNYQTAQKKHSDSNESKCFMEITLCKLLLGQFHLVALMKICSLLSRESQVFVPVVWFILSQSVDELQIIFIFTLV